MKTNNWIIVLFVFWATACAELSPKVEPLHVEGAKLMNESGETVELK